MNSIKLIVCETSSSNFNYHLRKVKEGEEKYGGAVDTEALCGTPIGWDTKIPLAAYGKADHLGSKWCQTCKEKSR